MMLRSLIQGLHQLRQQRASLRRLPGGAVPLDLSDDMSKGMLPLRIPFAPLQASTYVLFGRFDYGNDHHLIRCLEILANSAHRVKRSPRELVKRDRTCYKACYNLFAVKVR